MSNLNNTQQIVYGSINSLNLLNVSSLRQHLLDTLEGLLEGGKEVVNNRFRLLGSPTVIWQDRLHYRLLLLVAHHIRVNLDHIVDVNLCKHHSEANEKRKEMCSKRHLANLELRVVSAL